MSTPNTPTRRGVLIIDDSADVRAFFQLLADLHSLTLFAVANGWEGLELLRSLPADPSVIFVDWHMPGMDGAEFLRRKNELGLGRTSHVVVSSGGERADFASQARFDEWLQKPFDLARILEIVHNAEKVCSA